MASRSKHVAALAGALFVALGVTLAAQEPASAPQQPAAGNAHGAETVDCLRCHEAMRAKVAQPVPHKPVADGECARCHSPHAARYGKLLNLRERALCATCHKDKLASFMTGSVHTPVKDGNCTGCHEVHGSQNEKLLVHVGNDLCLGCHEQKKVQATLPTVHDPFVNGECLDCHKAHNSPYPAQLNAPASNLCQVCHAPDDEKLVEAHSGIPVKGAKCIGCHEPHASAFKGLLRSVTHAPFAEGSCEMCHMTDSDTPRVVRATGARLCGTCHREIPKSTDTLKHKPVADGNCSACHLPHAGDRKGLLPSKPRELCSSCHQELVKRGAESKSVHPIKDETGACLGCHTPHSSTEPHLLSNGEIRTCLTCHETAKHGHPLGDDRPDPRTGKPITCVTCHDPHGTEFAYTLRGDQSRGLCVQCHDTDHETPKKGKDGGGARK